MPFMDSCTVCNRQIWLVIPAGSVLINKNGQYVLQSSFKPVNHIIRLGMVRRSTRFFHSYE